MPDNQIGLEAIFENEEFQRGVNSYNSATSGASQNTEEAGSAMSAVWDGMAQVGTIALEAVAAGTAAFVAELYLAVDAAMEAEEVMARVAFVVDNVADRTGVTSEEVNELAGSLASVLPIDDEVIASAIAMGLTFDGVNEDNIQPLIGAAADLAQWTGKDLPNTMKTLSLAITDPERAMRLFKEANITLTDEQKKTLESMGEMGDTAGTTSFILEQLANKGILGLAEVMGDTSKGQLTIMQTALGNLQETLGTGLLSAFDGVIGKVTEFANDPRLINFLTEVGEQIGNVVEQFVGALPSIMDSLIGLGDWFAENKPIIIGALAAIGVAITALMIDFVIPAIAATITAFAPLFISLALIAAGVALLYTAWTENWGGIQDHVQALWVEIEPIFDSLVEWFQTNIPIALQYLSDIWTNILLPAIQEVFAWLVANVFPILMSLVEWLKVNVPIAIQFLSDLWVNTLLPAIQDVWSWIESNLIPLLGRLWDWLQTNVPAALQTLSSFWTNTLLPAIEAVWSWVSTNLIPLFQAVANLMSTVLTLALTALAGLWQNVLLPAIQAVGQWISDNLVPIFESIGDTVNDQVMPVLEPFAAFLKNVLAKAFEWVTEAIQAAIGWIGDLTEALSNIQLPDALTPGSPTPFELGLRGINEQLSRMAKLTLPALTQEMNVLATVRDVPGANGAANAGGVVSSSGSVNNYNYLFGASFNVNNQNGLLEILNGLR